MSFYPYTSVKNEEFPEIKEGDKLKIEKIIKEEKKPNHLLGILQHL